MKKILLFGDSNTWGHNPVDMSKHERPWPVILSELLPQYRFTADGECGRTTEYDTEGLTKKIGLISFNSDYIETGKIKDFDLVVIMLGTNDVLNSVGASPEQIAQSLKKFVDIIKASSNAQILIISPIYISEACMKHPVFSTLYSMDSVENSKHFAEFTKAMTKEENVHFMDAASVASPSEIDGIHMEPQEHEQLAYAVCDKITEIFPE